MEFINGVKRKQQNPTNWQFSDHPACMAEELPIRKSIKSKLGGHNVGSDN